jgi:hypothetical protein
MATVLSGTRKFSCLEAATLDGKALHNVSSICSLIFLGQKTQREKKFR